jgi:phospholipid/cholesterol/gamma-HCH transport system substrate-binding protein
MDNHTEKFKLRLGLFIAIGSILFLLAIFFIGKQKNLFNPVFKLTSTFKNISGLEVGNNVRFSGIIVGTVDNIRIINDSTVMVDMSIKKDVNQFIKSDCIVTIGSEGIIGDKLLIITQGSVDAPLASNGQQLASKEPVELDDIIIKLQATAVTTQAISKQIEELMSNINSRKGTLGRLIQDSTVVYNLDQALIGLKTNTKKLSENMDLATKNFLASLQGSVANIEAGSKQLAEVMAKINSGDGTLGKLINDTTIIQNLEQTMVNLKKGSESLNEDLTAAQENFLLREYFKRKERETAQEKKDSLEINTKEQKTEVNRKK